MVNIFFLSCLIINVIIIMQMKSAPGDYHWITNHLHVDLNKASLKPVLAFLLYWNTFEARLFERNFCTQSLKDDDVILLVDNKIVSDSFAYAKKRYVSTKGNLKQTFDKLGFRNLSKNNNKETDDEKFVKEVLLDECPSCKKQLIAIIIIVYRLRNNMFHGEKSISEASRQTTLLKWACRILGECLSQNEEDTRKASV